MGTPIAYDSILAGAITPAPNIDGFTFIAAANDKVSVAAVNTGDQLRGFQLKVEIYNSDGSLVKRVVGQSIRIDTILTGGNYTIWISDDNGFETGTYGLTLKRLIPFMGTPIAYDRVFWLALLHLHPTLTGSPLLQRNDKVSVAAVNTGDQLRGFQLKVEIYNPDGSLLKRVVGQSVRIDKTTGGNYTIWISDDNGFETGTYGLTLKRLIPFTGTPIVYDAIRGWRYYTCTQY